MGECSSLSFRIIMLKANTYFVLCPRFCTRHFVVVRSLSHVGLLAAPWPAAHQASLSITISQSLLKFMSIELVMLSNHVLTYVILATIPWVKNCYYPYTLRYSCLENPMDRGAWQATVHGITKSRARPNK